MISFAKIMRQVLTERLSFSQLLQKSDEKPDNSRMDRAGHVRSKSLRVTTMDEDEAWTFSYKSQGHHSTTGDRHQGYVRFFKEDVSSKDNAEDLECMVDCSCPDYRYRWAYNNAKAGAGITGNQSWSGNNGQPPKPKGPPHFGVGNLGEGLCKHLISLGKFLETKINPESPDPEDEAPDKRIVNPTPKGTSAPTDAPAPDDSYSDSRESGYSDSRGGLQERRGHLFEQMNRFVKANPQFDVLYE